jgi:hypothetical protein
MRKQINIDMIRHGTFLSLAIASLINGAVAFAADPLPPDVEHPPMPQGVAIESVDKHPVPDMLKNEAKREIDEMTKKGSVDVPEEAVSYIDRAIASMADPSKAGSDSAQNARFKAMSEVESELDVVPALLRGTPFERGKLLGAAPGGIKTGRGWTAVSRLFDMHQGKIILEEIDYAASGGGMTMIKEAINQNVNGHPAILRIKTSQSRKSITELTWATDRKIYNLSMNKAAKGKALEEFLELARTIPE